MPLRLRRRRRLKEISEACATSAPNYIEHNDARLPNASRSCFVDACRCARLLVERAFIEVRFDEP